MAVVCGNVPSQLRKCVHVELDVRSLHVTQCQSFRASSHFCSLKSEFYVRNEKTSVSTSIYMAQVQWADEDSPWRQRYRGRWRTQSSFRSPEIRSSKENTSVMTDSPTLSPELLALVGYIAEGPLLQKIDISTEDIISTISDWWSLGTELSKQLDFNVEDLDIVQRKRIYHYYLPTFFWCQKQLQQHKSSKKDNNGKRVSPLVIGISAPQGCGKSTLVESLEYLFDHTGSKAASVSLDDFYLTAADQAAMTASQPGNSLLELRGNAGSHDLVLGKETLQALKKLTTPEDSLKLPRYNKSAFQGRGDRSDSATWPTLEGPLDVVLFEGWMLGFEPLDPASARFVSKELEVVNEILASYDVLHSVIDSWIIIQVADPEWVYKWRLQAEVSQRSKGQDGMTDEQVSDFVSRYMPAYLAYLPNLYRKDPKGALPNHVLRVNIDENRSPIS